jgi:iron complex outermembrane receptor protein
VGTTTVDLDQAILRLTYDTDTWSIVSVSSWYDAEYFQAVDTDGSPLTSLEIDWQSETDAISQDLRFVSDFSGAFNFIAGIYYGKEDLAMQNLLTLYEDPTIIVGTPLGDLLTDFGMVDQRLNTVKESLAAYAQFRFNISERLGVDIGLRYTNDKNSLDYVNISRLDLNGNPLGSWVPGNITGTAVDNAFLPPEFDPAGVGFYIDGPYTLDSAPTFDQTEREWSGKISMDYTMSESMMSYLSYSRGYRSGNFNGGLYYVPRPLEDAYASPEFVNAYEVGLKAEFLNGRLRANTAAFYYDYTDQQFVNVVGVSTFLENAGKSEILGLEVELWAQATENLTLKASLGWLDTEYTELQLANTITSDPADQIDLAGNDLISAPDFNFSFAADYQFNLSGDRALVAHLDANFQDDQWFSAYNDSIGYGQIRQDDYWLVNARLSLIFGVEENYVLSAWAKNLMDEEYDSYAINVQAGFGFDYYLSGRPRTYGLEFNYFF